MKPGNDPSTYESWGYQLAAYRRALGPPVACMNLIVNSREAHPPVEAPWTGTELDRCWEACEAAMALWRVEKNFDPRGRAGLANAEKDGQALVA